MIFLLVEGGNITALIFSAAAFLLKELKSVKNRREIILKSRLFSSRYILKSLYSRDIIHLKNARRCQYALQKN